MLPDENMLPDTLTMHSVTHRDDGNSQHRYTISLELPHNDTRYGIPGGDDEADTYIGIMYKGDADWPHWFSSAGEMYRGFSELGPMWVEIGKASKRQDMILHGTALVAAAPIIFKSLHASLAANTFRTTNPLVRCSVCFG